jgi:hypothetical protein
MTDPTEPGWYGLICTDGEGEVWIAAAYWDERWRSNTALAYRRSPEPFPTEQQAMDWAHEQDD